MLALVIFSDGLIQSNWGDIYAFVHYWRLVLHSVQKIKKSQADLWVPEKESRGRKQSEHYAA